MGIKNLINVIERYAPDAIKIVTIKDYYNKTLGIDMNLLIYKTVLSIRKNGYDLKNDDIIVTHLHGTLQRLVAFKKHNIKAIFVFDGIPPELKADTMANRAKIWKALNEKYEKAKSLDEQKRYYYHKSDITSHEIFEVMELIKIFGFPIIESPVEADITLADLSKQDKIDAIVTDDLDILVFGGNNVLKGFSIAQKKKFQEISLEKLLSQAGLTQQQLIDIAIMIGCDYCPKARKVGPVNAYKLIKENDNIYNIVKRRLAWLPMDFKSARDFFRTKDEQVDTFTYIDIGIDKDKLLSFLEDHKFKPKYINAVMSNIKD
jgi:flap endonuclease-1